MAAICKPSNDHNSPLAGLSRWTCLWAALTAGTLAYVFEILRHKFVPSLSHGSELVATALFAAAASALGCSIVVTMGRRMHARLTREVAARKDAEQFFRVIALATNAGIWSWDLASDFTWFNPEFVEAYGYGLEEALAKDFWRSHIHSDERNRAPSSLFAAVGGIDSTWSE